MQIRDFNEAAAEFARLLPGNSARAARRYAKAARNAMRTGVNQVVIVTTGADGTPVSIQYDANRWWKI